MRLKEAEPGFTIIKEEYSVSGITLAELLRTTSAQKVPFRFMVKGFSMYPFIKDSDIVTISPLSNSSITFGKSVAFIHPYTGRFIIHRIVGDRKNYYLLKGDSAPGIDGLVPKKDILGVVTKVEREAKEVFFGLGPERFIIAFLSRIRLLNLVFLCWEILPISMRRFLKCRIHL